MAIRGWWAVVVMAGAMLIEPILADASGGGDGNGAHHFPRVLLWLAIMLIVAKLSSLIERFGLPPVLGELMAGVALGNLGFLGFHWFDPIKSDEIIRFCAEFGVVMLLFQVGLESNLAEMRRVGVRALLVATVGVFVPFLTGYWLAPWFFPNISSHGSIFLGATLTATSVGITARVFSDLGKLKSLEAKIVLGAAVIDDVMGLIILAVVSGLISSGSVSLGSIVLITLEAIAFFAVAIVVGRYLAKPIGEFFSLVHTGEGMKFVVAISFALVFAWAAGQIGLAPIVGAFAAGLVLDPVHFTPFRKPGHVESLDECLGRIPADYYVNFRDHLYREEHGHVENLIRPVGLFFIPIFFVYTGLQVKFETFLDVTVLGVALGVTAVAIAGKIASGLVAGRANRWIVGWGMVPRGEVGLVFATIGKTLGVVDDQMYSVIVVVVILTTLLPPPILLFFLKRQSLVATA